jgi:hypothetical protein
VDTGSGYNAQNDLPVHIGLATDAAVDVEATFPAAGRKVTGTARGIRPGRTISVAIKAP